MAAAMDVFWWHGYANTSMGELVEQTGVNRQGIYSEFGSKRGLFLACVGYYQEAVVTPAFATVEAADAKLAQVQAYFEFQFDAAESSGLPGPGCLVANTMTELADRDEQILQQVNRHKTRLQNGYLRVLKNESPELSAADAQQLAEMMVIFTQGLWSASRVVDKTAPLRASCSEFLGMLKVRISNA